MIWSWTIRSRCSWCAAGRDASSPAPGLDHYTIKCVAVAEDAPGRIAQPRLSAAEVVKLAARAGTVSSLPLLRASQSAVLPRLGVLPASRSPAARRADGEQSQSRSRRYCEQLREQRRPGQKIGGIVLNANPFTLGHRYLVEQAAARMRLAACVRREGGRVVVFLCGSLRAGGGGRKAHRQPDPASRVRLHHLPRHLSRLFPEGEGHHRS